MLHTALAFVLLCSLACAERLKSSEGAKDQGCPIEGNVDFYGSGVRIGICTVILLMVESLLPPDISVFRHCLAIFMARQQLSTRRDHRNLGNKFNIPSRTLRHRIHFLDTNRRYSCDRCDRHPSAMRRLSVQRRVPLGLSYHVLQDRGTWWAPTLWWH